MTSYIRIASIKPQASDTANRVVMIWVGPDGVQREYAVNQRTLNRYATADELKVAVDKFTQTNFGYVLTDVFFHKNRDGTWAVATGEVPSVWPEDMVA